MLDKFTAQRAAEAMQRATAFGIGPICETTAASMERALTGLNEGKRSCPDADQPANHISCPDADIRDTR